MNRDLDSNVKGNLYEKKIHLYPALSRPSITKVIKGRAHKSFKEH